MLEEEVKTFAYLRRKLTNIIALGLGDALGITLSLMIAGLFRWWLKGDHMAPMWGVILILLWWVESFATKLLPGWGLGASEELRRQVRVLSVVFGITIVALFLGKTSSTASRITLTFGFVIGLVVIPLIRAGIKRILLSRNLWGIPAVIYGSDQTVPLVIEALQKEKGFGYQPIGIFDDESAPPARIKNIPILGGTLEKIRSAPVAIIAMPSISRHDLLELLDGPLSVYRTVLVIPDLLLEAPSLWVQPRDLQGILGLEITDNLLDPFARFTKRIVDIVFVILTFPAWSFLSLTMALFIWLSDRGNPLYTQERISQNKKQFKMWKFRTMHMNGDFILEQKLAEDPHLHQEWNKNFKLKEDPRITPIGAFLRKTSLDELPQFINVLRGHMSLVGPRPLPDYHYDEFPERVRKLRDRVRPGITGLWQVSGRSEVGTAGMERWDTYYVRNWSVWLDIVILVRTIRVVFKKYGAY
ncbi:MAG: undecaprenyl-phosphate galactose phosphotransferase WbaP [Kiritimatiellae bacterium]|nr:undecaprenyl-phosphate galactose phosphotransferase WbaP [Kiritimatiellia bacterium]